jgi:hypothetical protein
MQPKKQVNQEFSMKWPTETAGVKEQSRRLAAPVAESYERPMLLKAGRFCIYGNRCMPSMLL